MGLSFLGKPSVTFQLTICHKGALPPTKKNKKDQKNKNKHHSAASV